MSSINTAKPAATLLMSVVVKHARTVLPAPCDWIPADPLNAVEIVGETVASMTPKTVLGDTDTGDADDTIGAADGTIGAADGTAEGTVPTTTAIEGASDTTNVSVVGVIVLTAAVLGLNDDDDVLVLIPPTVGASLTENTTGDARDGTGDGASLNTTAIVDGASLVVATGSSLGMTLNSVLGT